MKPEIKYPDFEKVDIRIGTVVKADVPEWSHWVMKLTVDLGEEIGERIIFSGIMKFYKPEDLQGKQYPFVVNLKPKRIGPPDKDGEYNYSQGMMLMADLGEDEAPILFNLPSAVTNGSVVR